MVFLIDDIFYFTAFWAISFSVAITVLNGWEDVALWVDEGWPKVEETLNKWLAEIEALFKEVEEFRLGDDGNFDDTLRTTENEYKIDRSNERKDIGTISYLPGAPK